MTNQQIMPAPGKSGALGRMLQDLGFAQPPRLSTEGKRFALVDATGNSMQSTRVDQQFGYYIDVVLADANEHKSKIYWGQNRKYVKGNTDPPLCWSDNGIAPSVNAVEPQSQTCANCPNNEIGSAISEISGARIRACQDRKKLAFFSVEGPNDDLYQLNIPPDTLGNLRAYGNWLIQNSKQLYDVVTRIYFDPQATNALAFFAISETPPRYDVLLDNMEATGASKAITGMDDVPRDPSRPLALRASAGQAQLPAPQQPQPSYAPPQQPQGFQAPPQQVLPPPQQPQQFQAPPPAQQPQGFQPPQQNGAGPPAPKSGRGGRRSGAGRPAQTAEQAGQQAPPQGFQAPPSAVIHGIQGAPTAQGGAAFGAPPPQATPAAGGFQPPPAQPYTPPAGAVDAGPIPPFLQRAATPVAGPQQAAPQAPQPQFGMAPGAQPDERTRQALNAAFAPQQPGAPRA